MCTGVVRFSWLSVVFVAFILFTSSPIPKVAATVVNYNYTEVLNVSLLFYEAQRTGKLPSNNRIKWRGDSMLMDKGINGEDLTGGYFDAGDHVKFVSQLAWTTTVLSWGVIDYPLAYQNSTLLARAQEAIKWATDFLIKAHVKPNEIYGQIGNTTADHSVWNRPEDWNTSRPAWKATPTQPGSEIAGETAAAFAAANMVFKSSNPTYAATLLTRAQQLYNFANQYRGNFASWMPGATVYSGYGDELGWAAAWLLRATKNQTYRARVDQHIAEFNLTQRQPTFGADDKRTGLQALMAKITNETSFRNLVQNYCGYVVNAGPKTPKGLYFINAWGSLRYASNTAFICLQAADLNINKQVNLNFVQSQIGYMLGDTGRSFVIGFGQNYPLRAHHRGSSCASRPAICNWSTYTDPAPNPHVLYGGLVGGPDRNDTYIDIRTNVAGNEVALDYNAAFQTTVAGLLQYQLKP